MAFLAGGLSVSALALGGRYLFRFVKVQAISTSHRVAPARFTSPAIPPHSGLNIWQSV